MRLADDEWPPELRALHDRLVKLEAERDAISRRIDEIEAESFDTPEQEADIARRLEAVEREAEAKQVEIYEAEDDWRLALEEDDEDNDDAGERLSVEDAAAIWLSKGMDEDYTFGYAEEELRRAGGV